MNPHQVDKSDPLCVCCEEKVSEVTVSRCCMQSAIPLNLIITLGKKMVTVLENVSRDKLYLTGSTFNHR
jgi:hypothetical protein